LGSLLVAAALLLARPAAAEEAPTGGWYGYQTLLADGVAAVLAGRAASTAPTEARNATPTLAVYVLGAPSVHLIHGHPARALEDAGLRAAAPALGAAAGILVGGGVGLVTAQVNPRENTAPFAYAVYGAAAGLGAGLLASVTVDAIFAKDPPRTPDRSANAMPVVRPDVVLDPRNPGIGVRGTF
jgi:hypothetical protein